MSKPNMYEKTKNYFNGDVLITGRNTKKICEWLRSKVNYDRYEDYQTDFILMGKNEDKERLPCSCKCGKTGIMDQRIIYIKSLKESHIIGSECVFRFINSEGKRRCPKTCYGCGTPHNNKKDKYCKKCLAIENIKSYIIPIGKYKGFSIEHMYNDQNYCKWILSIINPKGKMYIIQNYLNIYKNFICIPI